MGCHPSLIQLEAESLTQSTGLPADKVKKILEVFNDLSDPDSAVLSYEEFLRWLPFGREDEGYSVFVPLTFHKLGKLVNPGFMTASEFVMLTTKMCTSTKLALLEEVFNHFDGVEEDGIYYADFIRFEKQCPMGRTKVDPNHLIKAAIKKEAARLGETKKWTPAEKLFSFKTLLAVHKHVFKCTYPLFFIQDFMQEHVLGKRYWRSLEAKKAQKERAASEAMMECQSRHGSVREGAAGSVGGLDDELEEEGEEGDVDSDESYRENVGAAVKQHHPTVSQSSSTIPSPLPLASALPPKRGKQLLKFLEIGNESMGDADSPTAASPTGTQSVSSTRKAHTAAAEGWGACAHTASHNNRDRDAETVGGWGARQATPT